MDDMDSASFFDHIDDLMEFPSDNDCVGNELRSAADDVRKDFPSIWADESLSDAYLPFPGSNITAASELSADLSVPYEDIIQLEWLSNFVEDSFSGGGMTLTQNHTFVSNNNQFHTSSPVSVLESSSSNSSSSSTSSVAKYTPLGPIKRGPHRARSKRPRPATFSPRGSMIQFICPSPATNTLLAAVESDHAAAAAEKFLVVPNAPVVQKMKKLNLKVPFSPMEVNVDTDAAITVRKCLHCEITKTPQWRAGPMGPKTLCNACGVRYKSGRLFPEYRPAASPTFSPSLHSNSHKKVVQMRTKVVVVENEPQLARNLQ